jgi:hypothetical protein
VVAAARANSGCILLMCVLLLLGLLLLRPRASSDSLQCSE